jgi:hypothetical protein
LPASSDERKPSANPQSGEQVFQFRNPQSAIRNLNGFLPIKLLGLACR